MTASIRHGSGPLIAGAGILAGALTILGAEISPLVPLLVLVTSALLVFAFLRPVWALYAAICVIPLERLATSFGELTFSPTEAMLSAAAIGWIVRRLVDGNLSWRKTPLTAPLALFTLSVAPGLLIAIDRAVVVKQLASGLLIFTCFLLFVSEAGKEDTRRMAITVALVGAIVAAIAIASPPVGSATRAQGPFSQANTLGQFIALAVPLQVALAIASRGWLRVLLVIGALLSIGGLIASGSRGSFIGIAAMALVLLAWRPFRYVSLVAVFLLVPLAVSGLGPTGGVPELKELKERFLRIGQPSDESSKQRLEIYRKTPKMVIENPLFGVGASNFYKAAPKYGLALPNSRYAQAHDTPLAIAAERGLLGLGALIWFAVVLVAMIRRVLARAPPEWTGLAWGLAGVFATQGLICIFEYSIPAAPLTLTTLCLAGCVCLMDAAFGRAPEARRMDGEAPVPGRWPLPQPGRVPDVAVRATRP